MTLLSTDPIDIALNAAGDLDLTAFGSPQFSMGTAGVVQAIQIVLNMVAGEWFLNLDAGIKYMERVGVTADEALLGQKFDQGKTIKMFSDALHSVPGVNTVGTITAAFDNKTRILTVAWTVSTVFGDTVSDVLAKAA